MKKRFVLGALGAALLAGGIAFAQTLVPLATTINQTDAMNYLPRGQPSAQSGVVQLGSIGGMDEYTYLSPATGFAVTPSSLISLLFLSPSATIAAGAIGMEATPGDGQRFCLDSTQTVSSFAVTPNTSQNLAGLNAGTIGALSANTEVCWHYIGPQFTWFRYK